MANDKIYVIKSSLPNYLDYINEIKDLWTADRITNVGIKHRLLESQLATYLEASAVRLFTNGHLALESVLAALDLNGEVITTPFTFVSTTHAIVKNNLTPVFCDIRNDNFTMDIEKLELLITKDTCAILPVHVYGNICDVQAIEVLAKKYNLKVIYDAAHAFGVHVDKHGISEYGNATMFSFHATKVFHSIEGGAIATEDLVLANKLSSIRNFGITGQESVDYIAGNSKMNEFQAAMGLCNMRLIDEYIKSRKEVVERYREQLKGIKNIQLQKEVPGVQSNYSYFPIVFTEGEEIRDKIKSVLEVHQIYTRKYFYPLTSNLKCYENFDPGNTPVAEYIACRVLTLPLYPELELAQVDRICKIIREEMTR